MPAHGPDTKPTDRHAVDDFVRGIPKAELHLHIEGTLEPELMLALGARNGVQVPYADADEARAAYRFSDLRSFLNLYYRGMAVLRHERDFFELTEDYLHRVHADGARHVEVFAKYLDEKLSGHYPVNAHLRMLLDDIIADSRWDMTYLGMQIVIESLALSAFGDMARFRVSVFKAKGDFGLVLRQIPAKMLTMEQIGLPPSAKELLYKPRGLVLVTGPTGSGKTTTLASMINIINEERDEAHIVTIEDPIEYYHTHKKAIVTQREIGVDVPNFAEALRRVLRQDPDVVLVGEMRDLETIAAAITLAETGHLVFAELKPNSLQLPIFLFRWDHGNNVVDVDIFQNDKPCNDLWDTKGYTGHRAEKIDEGKREYSFLIEIPGRKIFEGAIRVGLSFGLSVEPASFIMTGGSADVKVNRAENKDIKSKK